MLENAEKLDSMMLILLQFFRSIFGERDVGKDYKDNVRRRASRVLCFRSHLFFFRAHKIKMLAFSQTDSNCNYSQLLSFGIGTSLFIFRCRLASNQIQ